MKQLLAMIGKAAAGLYSLGGDPRTKNWLLIILAAMTAFGMVAPNEATSIRDTLLKLAL